MSKHTVHFKEWEAGDWLEVFVDGEDFPLCSQHSFHVADAKDLLLRLGIEVTEEVVPDEETEGE